MNFKVFKYTLLIVLIFNPTSIAMHKKKSSTIDQYNFDEQALITLKTIHKVVIDILNQKRLSVNFLKKIEAERTILYDNFSKLKTDHPLKVKNILKGCGISLFKLFYLLDGIIPTILELHEETLLLEEIENKSKNKSKYEIEDLINIFLKDEDIKKEIIEFCIRVKELRSSKPRTAEYNGKYIDFLDFILKHSEFENCQKIYAYSNQIEKLSKDQKIELFFNSPKAIFYYLIYEIKCNIKNNNELDIALPFQWYLLIYVSLITLRNKLLKRSSADLQKLLDSTITQYNVIVDKLRNNKNKIEEIYIDVQIKTENL